MIINWLKTLDIVSKFQKSYQFKVEVMNILEYCENTVASILNEKNKTIERKNTAVPLLKILAKNIITSDKDNIGNNVTI